MKFIVPLVLLFVFSFSERISFSQIQLSRDTETTVSETAYTVVPSYGGKYKVIVAIVAINPFEDRFASRPSVRITVRATDGSVITTREVGSAGIPPKSRIAFCESLYADEAPAKVEFRPLNAGYEETIYRPANFLSFELLNVRVRDDISGRLRITGEIKILMPERLECGSPFFIGTLPGNCLVVIPNTNRQYPKGHPRPLKCM
jgi:hypothetical protein